MKLTKQVKKFKKKITNQKIVDPIVGLVSVLMGLLLSFTFLWGIKDFSLTSEPLEQETSSTSSPFFTITSTIIILCCSYYVYQKTKMLKSIYHYSASYIIVFTLVTSFTYIITKIRVNDLIISVPYSGVIISFIIFKLISKFLYALSFFIIARYTFREYEFPKPKTFFKWTCFAFVIALVSFISPIPILKLDYALSPEFVQVSYKEFMPYNAVLGVFYYIFMFIAALSATAFILSLFFTIFYAGYEAYRKRT